MKVKMLKCFYETENVQMFFMRMISIKQILWAPAAVSCSTGSDRLEKTKGYFFSHKITNKVTNKLTETKLNKPTIDKLLNKMTNKQMDKKHFLDILTQGMQLLTEVEAVGGKVR